MLCIISILTSCQIFYYPEKEYEPIAKEHKKLFTEITFPTTQNKILTGWFFKPKTKKIKGTVLHLHSNSGNISYFYLAVLPLVKDGYQVLMFDYKGFGKSQGSPSQKALVEDSLSTLTYLQKRPDVDKNNLILFGQSIGANLAIVIAAIKPKAFKLLIAESPFTGHLNIAAHHAGHYLAPRPLVGLFIQSEYDSIDWIEKVKCPILIIHPETDTIIPFTMGKTLYEKAKSPKLLWKTKGEHMEPTTLQPKIFIEKVNEILK